MALCPLCLALWEPKATSQWALLRCRKRPLLRKVGSNRSGQVYFADAGPSPGWLGHPERAGEHVQSTGPCLEARLMTPCIPACISGELVEGRPISWNSPNAHTSEWRGEK